jgi:hypothetical protein
MKELEKKSRFVEQSLQGFAMDLCSNLDGMYYEGTKGDERVVLVFGEGGERSIDVTGQDCLGIAKTVLSVL